MSIDFQQTAWSYVQEDTTLHQAAWLFALHTLNLNMEAVHSFKMLVNLYQTTQLHIPQNGTLHRHNHENLKSTLNVHAQYKKSTINISVHKMYIFCTVQHATLYKVQVESLLTYFWEVFDLSFSWETSYPEDFVVFLSPSSILN
jgi:hypothetical protein